MLAPLLIPGLGAVVLYLVARLVTRRNAALAGLTATLCLAGLGAVLRMNARLGPTAWPTWAPDGAPGAVLQADPGGMLIAMVALGLGFAVAIYSGRYLALDQRYETYYPLLLLLITGLVGMAMAVDLFTLYLCTVLASASSYVLVAFRRRTATAIEAGFKYLVMGSMGSVMVLAGIGFVLGGAGTLQLPLPEGALRGWSGLGVGLILFGYFVKAAMFPTHTWLPDAHGRAPSSISAVLSGIMVQTSLYTAVKVGLGLGLPGNQLGWLLVALSIPSMTLGNLMALRQTYGKRLLGYSSIANVGYMALAFGLGLAHARPEAIAAALFLLVAHAAMKALAFLSKGVFHFACGASLVSELDGLGRRVSVAGAGFVVALAGLSGLPPLAGFMAKLGLLTSFVQKPGLGAKVALAALLGNSLVGLAYYLPLVGRVLRLGREPEEPVEVSPWMQAPVILLTLIVLLMGLFPGVVLAQAQRAAQFLLLWGRP